MLDINSKDLKLEMLWQYKEVSLIISLSYLSPGPSLRPSVVSARYLLARYDLQTRIGGLSPPTSEIRSALILLSPASLYLTSTLGRPAYFRNKYLGIVNNKAQIITLSPFAALSRQGLQKEQHVQAAPQQIFIRIKYQIEVICNSITICFNECIMLSFFAALLFLPQMF